MSATIAIPKRRITGGMKAVMLTIALMFDAAIILMIIGAFVLAVGLGGAVVKPATDASGTLCEASGYLGTIYGAVVHDPAMVVINGVLKAAGSDRYGAMWDCESQSQAVGQVAGVATVMFTGAGFLMFFPVLAAIVSAFAAFTSVLLFTAWFYALRVNVWGMKLSKIGLNMLTFVIESIPVLNLAPMQTINVWGHIRIAKKEDDAAIEKATAKLRAQETRDGFMQGRAPRKPSRDAVNQQMASEGVFAA